MDPVPRPLRVQVRDDHTLVVAGVSAMLHPFRDRVEVVGPGEEPVDVVLVDTFAALQPAGAAERRCGTTTKVVAYSWNLDPVLVEQALAEGAAGYLSKALEPEVLVGCLEDIVAGRTVVSPAPGAHDRWGTRAGGPDGWPGRSEGLSERESEVLALVVRGLRNEQIARRLFLSINSVKTYIRSAYRKVGATTRAEAIVWGYRHGFEPQVSPRVAAELSRRSGPPAPPRRPRARH
ncbi:response regulator transcription factor [Nocardioides flavescens]|uniref:DNA-binding response regulator n=1 Tax=Nocardioides flavescens TaxID=2691959 RepID=A0A6L7F3K9_9ACTN|nr:response regulator transcription factor [Nocardioides flavescens]MXG91806.1 DNA-binding response regulator [Nocardioides flavescens]